VLDLLKIALYQSLGQCAHPNSPIGSNLGWRARLIQIRDLQEAFSELERVEHYCTEPIASPFGATEKSRDFGSFREGALRIPTETFVLFAKIRCLSPEFAHSGSSRAPLIPLAKKGTP
jgi:hypothetical protein